MQVAHLGNRDAVEFRRQRGNEGVDPPRGESRRADVFRITNVTPQSIPWTQGMDPDNPGAGKRFHVFGPRLTADCTIEGQVNGSTVELNNVLYINKQFEGLLMYRDINYDSVSPRYAELKLIIKRTALMAAIARIPFAVN